MIFQLPLRVDPFDPVYELNQVLLRGGIPLLLEVLATSLLESEVVPKVLNISRHLGLKFKILTVEILDF